MSDSDARKRFEGKITVVAGGNSGVGLASSELFINEGAARVYLIGRRYAELESTAHRPSATHRLELGGRPPTLQSEILNRRHCADPGHGGLA